jgi:hypothetical protein
MYISPKRRDERSLPVEQGSEAPASSDDPDGVRRRLRNLSGTALRASSISRAIPRAISIYSRAMGGLAMCFSSRRAGKSTGLTSSRTIRARRLRPDHFANSPRRGSSVQYSAKTFTVTITIHDSIGTWDLKRHIWRRPRLRSPRTPTGIEPAKAGRPAGSPLQARNMLFSPSVLRLRAKYEALFPRVLSTLVGEI